MRFVPTNCLREGMSLASPLYGRNDEVMLMAGTCLSTKYIDAVNRLNYNGVYINDELSGDLEITNVISEALRKKTVQGIKKVFIHAEKKENQKIDTREAIKLIEQIIEEILENKNNMVNMIDLKVFDDYTYYHSANVAVLSIILGMAYGLNKENLYRLGVGALLHDMGKVFIAKEILNKDGRLSNHEMETIKAHPSVGYKYVKEHFDIPLHSYVAILDHHEKYDGSGYPEGKKGEKISLFGRIITIADVYDALTSDRPYRKAMLPSEAMEYIMGASGSLFDPEMVMLFTRKVAPYPIGTCVQLSNDMIGIVLKNFESCCLRPIVRVFNDGSAQITPYEVNLRDERSYMNVTIAKIAEI